MNSDAEKQWETEHISAASQTDAVNFGKRLAKTSLSENWPSRGFTLR